MIAVITGATGAIGQQICREFARHGIDVAVCYNRREAEAQALAAELATSVRAVAVGLSLEDPTSIARAFDYIHSVFGHVDYLVNNAGISLIKPLLDTTPDEWQRMLAVNLTSAYYTCRQVLPKMYHTGGSILNVSSMWGSLGASCEVAYATAKAGLEGFTRSLAEEYAGTVRVNAVAPGFVLSPMNAHLTPEEVEEFFRDNPTMHPITPEEVATLCYQVATDPTKTGQIVPLGWE